MAPRKPGKRAESDSAETLAVENNDVSTAKKKKIQQTEELKEVRRLPRAAKNKSKPEPELAPLKAAPRQKASLKKTETVDKKVGGKRTARKTELEFESEKIEVREVVEAEKPAAKRSRGKASKKIEACIEKVEEAETKSKAAEEKSSPISKKGKSRIVRVEAATKRGRGKKDVDEEVVIKSDNKGEDKQKEQGDDEAAVAEENGVESEIIENGKESEKESEEKVEVKSGKKGKGKMTAKKGKAATKSKVIEATNRDQEQDSANRPEVVTAQSA